MNWGSRCDPRTADLVQRIEAAGLTAAAGGGSGHLRRLAEKRRIHVAHERAEVGVVEDVEEIRARPAAGPGHDETPATYATCQRMFYRRSLSA